MEAPRISGRFKGRSHWKARSSRPVLTSEALGGYEEPAVVTPRPTAPRAGEWLRDVSVGEFTVVDVGTEATDHPSAEPAHRHAGAGARRIVAVAGELDIAAAPHLRDRLQVVTGPGEDVVVDVQALTFIDVAGSRALAAAAEQQRRRGGSLAVAGATPAVQRVLNLLGWSSLLASEVSRDIRSGRARK